MVIPAISRYVAVVIVWILLFMSSVIWVETTAVYMARIRHSVDATATAVSAFTGVTLFDVCAVSEYSVLRCSKSLMK